MDWLIYIAAVLGAAGLILLMPKRRFNVPPLGGLLLAAGVGVLWLGARLLMPWPEVLGIPDTAFIYYYVFSAISLVAAVRVITHTKPVYAALWFVLVVLSSAGLFLTLSAEFIAFAMVIIYGGAILVTYMFVIMLASQSSPSQDPDDQPEYDRLAREPIAAAAAGFLLLAVLLTFAFDTGQWPDDAGRRMELVGDVAPAEGVALPGTASASDAVILATVLRDKLKTPRLLLDEEVEPVSNTELVGLDLFQSHPLGLELAGVVLLVSLIGAVVIARTRVPEEESGHDEAEPGMGGATVNPTHEPGPDEEQAFGASEGRLGV